MVRTLPLIAAIAAASAWGQVAPYQASLLRGVLLERDSDAAAGEFAVRGPGNEVVRYRFDGKTRIERDERLAAMSLLRPGEEVEVESDAISDSPLRYARVVRSVGAKLPPPPVVRVPRARTSLTPPLDPLFQRGDLTFSGVVAFLNDGRLVLRTRDSGEQTILLRQDTRYLSSGDIVPVSDLKANMRVFVRAGKDLFGHTEAYQVMWGGFLQPRDR